jgi:hypothetical protein
LPPVSTKEITDGTSNTLLVGEYHTETDPDSTYSRRTMWAYGYTSYNQSSTIDAGQTLIPDYNRCVSTHTDEHECKRAWGSLHAANIIQFVRCDGSGAQVTPEIDLAAWCAMGTIQAEDPRL